MLSIFSQFIFGNSSLFGTKDAASGSSSWRDKSLCFDLRQTDLELDHGEQLIACFFPIEDIKGNQDEVGLMKVTNLRLIWICCNKRRVNLSIGWRTVSLTFEQNLKDSLGLPMTSLCILTKYESTKYEFVFNKMPAYSEFWNGLENYSALVQLEKFRHEKSLQITHLTPMYLDEPFEVVFKVWQCYKHTSLFRHCRANLSNLITSNQEQDSQKLAMKLGDLKKLAGEEIIDIYPGIVQSESRSIKYIGSLILTNVRIIWVDDLLPMRNLSIPYLRIDSIKFKQSDKVVIHTHDYLATSNQIEFRAQRSLPTDKLAGSTRKTRQIFEQIQNLFSLFKARPKFGPEACEDCVNFMSHLKPIEHYFESFNDSMGEKLENFGPEMNRIYLVDADEKVAGDKENRKGAKITPVDESVDRNESELFRYSAKLNSYLNEQPIEHDRELIYSTGISLTTDGIYKEQVNLEEKGNGPYFGFRLYAPIGFLMIVYSIAGFCLNYIGRLREKLFTCWLLNVLCITLGFLRGIFSTNQEPKTMNILDEETR